MHACLKYVCACVYICVNIYVKHSSHYISCVCVYACIYVYICEMPSFRCYISEGEE